MTDAIRNATEQLVVAELQRQFSSGSPAEAACRCEGCRQDVAALALSSLPPHYCTRFDCEEALAREGALWVHEAVVRSAERVALHPKHGRVNGMTPSHRFRLVNFSFEECSSLVEPLLLAEEGACSCPDCRTDALAYALNRYPPKYGVERDGEIDFPERERRLIRDELTSIVSTAVKIVASNPRHSDC